MSKLSLCTIAIILAIGSTDLSVADTKSAAVKNTDNMAIAKEQFVGNKVSFSANNDVQNVTLTVTGPNGYSAHVFLERGIPAIDLKEYGEIDDGVYNYQLTAATNELVGRRDELNNGRDKKMISMKKGIQQSGHFRVVKGIIHIPNVLEREKRYKASQ